MFETAEILILLAAVAGSGAMVGILANLFGRLKRLEERPAPDADAVRQLTHELEAVRDELESARKQIGQVAERLDFNERLLQKGRDDE